LLLQVSTSLKAFRGKELRTNPWEAPGFAKLNCSNQPLGQDPPGAGKLSFKMEIQIRSAKIFPRKD
jgi:hypothetical protein